MRRFLARLVCLVSKNNQTFFREDAKLKGGGNKSENWSNSKGAMNRHSPSGLPSVVKMA